MFSLCFILLTLSNGSVLINTSKIESTYRAQQCDKMVNRPYAVVLNDKAGAYCVRETPEEIQDKIKKECK